MDNKSFLIKDNMNSTTMINKIKKQCAVWGTNTFITKPQPGGSE